MNTTVHKSKKSVLTEKQATFLAFLKEYLEDKGYPPTVREIMNGLNLSSTNIIRKYLIILERKGYIKRQGNSSRAIEIVGLSDKDKYEETRHVPVAGRVRAGAPHPAIEDITGYLSVDKTLCRNDGAFFLRVEGDSMINAHIQEGDLVLVQPQSVANNGEIVVALINDEATVKKFYKKGSTIQLRPEHPTMKPIILKGGQEDVRIIGKVTAVVRLLNR